jgi:hypothetical protein
MLTKNKRPTALVILLIVTLLAIYGQAPNARAAWLADAKNTLSDSDLGVAATSTITFVIGEALYVNDFAQVIFPTDFTEVDTADITCGNAQFDQTASSTGNYVECLVDVGNTIATTSTITITVAGAVNPGTSGYKKFVLNTYDAGGTIQESANVMVYIIDDVTVSATVDATLTFTIGAVNADTAINGVTTTGTSTATEMSFGTINSTGSSTMGQSLRVITNADDGFIVTVQQDGELQSAAAATINSFNNSQDGYGSTTPVTWRAPLGILANNWTYGHMGLTSNDADLGTDFTSSKYAGLNGTNAMTIMSHGGPADGTTQNSGLAYVAYTIEITAMQEAGDYENRLTYICTPTY